LPLVSVIIIIIIIIILLLLNELIIVALSPKTARTLNKEKNKMSCAMQYDRIRSYKERLHV